MLPAQFLDRHTGLGFLQNPMICCSVKRFFMFVFFSENELY
ncbi:hypothetical protein DM77_3606 [Burkholderia mallei]|nr:hypothetical protein DM77_3606 [Burkholderia mallei]KOT18908.1 hypothetical protein DM52_1379 [Burkholderia mallei]